MAYGKYRKRRTRKRARRTAKRRRTYYRMSRPILSGFPRSKLVKLRYVEQVSLDPALGSFTVSEWRANSVFDPNFTGVGHQPMGFDQWAQLYERYVVTGSRISVQFAPTSTVSVQPGFYGVTLYGTSGQLTTTYSGNVDSIMELKLTGQKVLMAGNVNNTFQPRTLSKNFSARRFFGKSNVMDDPDLGAIVSTNPINKAYFGLWYGNSGGNDAGSANFKVMIDYIVLFHEPYLTPES